MGTKKICKICEGGGEAIRGQRRKEEEKEEKEQEEEKEEEEKRDRAPTSHYSSKSMSKYVYVAF